MRKKTTWAASVVRKQLQTCCQHETLSLDTAEREDDFSEGFEVPSEVYVSSPIKETALPSLLRRKSFNVSHVRNLLTTPESQSPHRKSVESALPLCAGSKFKPRRLQYVKGSPTLVASSAVATPMPLPVPSRPEAPKSKAYHKSGPLPMMIWNAAMEGSDTEMNTASPVRMKKYFSGPLIPSMQRKLPSSGSPSPPAAAGAMVASGKQPIQMGRDPSPTSRLMKVQPSSTHAPYPAVATSKLNPSTVAEGRPKKGAQLAKITPILDKKGSRGFRLSRGDSNPTAPNSTEVKSRGTTTMARLAKAAQAIVVASPSTRDGGGRIRKSRSSSERERISAAVKIQAAIRGYRARKAFAIELARANNLSGELTDEELEEAPSISTRMSRTNPKTRNRVLGGARVGMEQVSKSWNGSLRTAQDCQAILKSKQEAALKRERAMEYAMSRQNWKAGSRSQKAGPALVLDDTFPDKPSWVWNWLERAARMGAHNSVNRIFDSDFDNNEPVSESVSVKSTVGVCTTTELGSGDMDLAVPMTYPWPLSLRQQHAAGLLKKKKMSPLARPSPYGTSESSPQQQRDSQIKSRAGIQQGIMRVHQLQREVISSTPADSCVTSQMGERLSPTNPRKLDFTEDVTVKQNDDGAESVGSCAGPLPSLYRLYSPFAGPRTRSQSGLQQPRMSKSNSLKVKVNPHGHNVQSKQVPTAVSESDSAGTTAASVRRPFWRP